MYYGKVEISGIDTSKLKVLNEEEKTTLLKKVREGDEKAREALIKGNLRLVLSVIQRFTGRGEAPDDLFQVGCIGLIKAIDNFSLEFGVKFSTYAVPMIYGSGKALRKERMSLYITRRKALEMAIEALKEKEPAPEIEQAITRLYYMANSSSKEVRWTKETIFEAINEWVNEHGRHPIAADLYSPNLPKPSTIKSVFNTTIKDFLNEHYPSNPKGFKRKQNCLPKEKYMEIFKAEYSRINPQTAKEYDLKRSPDTPCWETIAIHNDAHGWKELLAVSGVKRVCKENKPTVITVVSHSPELEKLTRLIEKKAM